MKHIPCVSAYLLGAITNPSNSNFTFYQNAQRKSLQLLFSIIAISISFLRLDRQKHQISRDSITFLTYSSIEQSINSVDRRQKSTHVCVCLCSCDNCAYFNYANMALASAHGVHKSTLYAKKKIQNLVKILVFAFFSPADESGIFKYKQSMRLK